MTHVKLVVQEPNPGDFVWALMESEEDGSDEHEVQSADAGVDSYEAALAAGTRALKRRLGPDAKAH